MKKKENCIIMGRPRITEHQQSSQIIKMASIFYEYFTAHMWNRTPIGKTKVNFLIKATNFTRDRKDMHSLINSDCLQQWLHVVRPSHKCSALNIASEYTTNWGWELIIIWTWLHVNVRTQNSSIFPRIIYKIIWLEDISKTCIDLYFSHKARHMLSHPTKFTCLQNNQFLTAPLNHQLEQYITNPSSQLVPSGKAQDDSLGDISIWSSVELGCQQDGYCKV